MLQGAGGDALNSYGSNVGIVVGDRGQLVVDSGFHNGTARQIMRFLYDPKHTTPAKFVINTHYHSDHTFGNGFLAHHGSPVIAQEKARREILKKSARLLELYKNRGPEFARMLRGVRVHPPNVTFRDQLSLYLDDLSKVELVHPGYKAHTDGDTIVHSLKDRVLFTGDILWVNYHPNLEDADIQGQIRALRMILRMRPRKIVPGHGPLSGPKEVRLAIRYLEQLERNTKKALSKKLRGKDFFRAAIPPWAWNWKMRWALESHLESLLE